MVSTIKTRYISATASRKFHHTKPLTIGPNSSNRDGFNPRVFINLTANRKTKTSKIMMKPVNTKRLNRLNAKGKYKTSPIHQLNLAAK